MKTQPGSDFHEVCCGAAYEYTWSLWWNEAGLERNEFRNNLAREKKNVTWIPPDSLYAAIQLGSPWCFRSVSPLLCIPSSPVDGISVCQYILRYMLQCSLVFDDDVPPISLLAPPGGMCASMQLGSLSVMDVAPSRCSCLPPEGVYAPMKLGPPWCCPPPSRYIVLQDARVLQCSSVWACIKLCARCRYDACAHGGYVRLGVQCSFGPS